MKTFRKSDRVRLLRWHTYKGEIIPDIPSDQWTAIVLDVWGISHTFAKVKRECDGRIFPVMDKELEHIDVQESTAPITRRKRREPEQTGEPVLF